MRTPPVSASGGEADRKDEQALRQGLGEKSHHGEVERRRAQADHLQPQLLSQRARKGEIVDEVQIEQDVADAATPLTLVAERALQLQLVDDARCHEQLTELAIGPALRSFCAHRLTSARAPDIRPD